MTEPMSVDELVQALTQQEAFRKAAEKPVTGDLASVAAHVKNVAENQNPLLAYIDQAIEANEAEVPAPEVDTQALAQKIAEIRGEGPQDKGEYA